MSTLAAAAASAPGNEAVVESAPRPLDIPRKSRVYVNRNLRLDRIEMVGFDMDYTLAIYNQPRIEQLSIQATLDKLVMNKGYPNDIRLLAYDPALAIRGLVVDRTNGNIFKPDRYGFPGRA
ncbi:MAG: 5'-nucleotidase domain-containing protein, partial [Myxococcales bacterium]